ncbi:MAG: short-chain dehydrogenase [Lautropia sp. SCN 70-15]|jgi:NAD(P)-dependent dehydrogenase (short-subunit alcohol dehydrogenase family)|nr:MAG: short-chain dehydrogenase [Lautropia sp. SCN 70-15]
MKERCIVVTGASRGIGAAIAGRLARAGYAVACLSRSGALPELPDLPGDARARLIAGVADVTRAGSIAEAIGKIAEGFEIVGLVNNAGVHLEGASAEITLGHYDQVMATNATSVLLGCQAVYPHLAARKGGLIVNLGSFFDKLGVKRNLAYCASKAAVGAMTRCLAVEWAGKGIRVLDVAPGYIHTDLNHEAITQGPLRAYLEKRIPGREPGTADDVARLVASLFTSDIPFLTGETLYIDGAQGIAH